MSRCYAFVRRKYFELATTATHLRPAIDQGQPPDATPPQPYRRRPLAVSLLKWPTSRNLVGLQHRYLGSGEARIPCRAGRGLRAARPSPDEAVADADTQAARATTIVLPAVRTAPSGARCAARVLGHFREATHGHRVGRATKEAVAAAVSAINTCPYCVDVHTTMLHALGDTAPAAAIASGGDVADPNLGAVVGWARANRQPDAPIHRQRPFPDEHAPELIGVALGYHYINRMVNIFAAASPFPATATIKPMARRLAVPVFRRLLARQARSRRIA